MKKLLSRVVALLMIVAISCGYSFAQAQFGKAVVAPTYTAKQQAKEVSKEALKPRASLKSLKKNSTFATPGVHAPLRVKRNMANLVPGYPDFYAGVLYSVSESISENNMYLFSSSDASAELVAENVVPYSGGCLAGDYYYACDLETLFGFIIASNFCIYDANTWELISVTDVYDNMDFSAMCYSMAYDPTTDKVYGCFYDENLTSIRFGVLNPESATSTEIAPLNEYLFAMGFDNNGQCYGMSVDGVLYKIDKNTGALDVIKETGIATEYICGGTVNSMTGEFYWLPCTEAGTSFYKIDTATGAAQHIYDFPEMIELNGAFVPAPEADPAAPAMPTIVSIDFVDASQIGSLTFQAPETLFDGSEAPAGQTLSWAVKVNGVEVANGEGLAYGAQETVTNIRVAEPGNTTFSVVVYNEVGSSPAAKGKKYIGFDQPQAVKNVKLVYEDGNMKLTWDRVDESVNGGYMGMINYVVKTMDGQVVKEGLIANRLSIPTPEPEVLTMYQYTVQAVSMGIESVPTASNRVTLGAIIPPFEENFDADGTYELWTIVDANGDGRTWSYNGGEMCAIYSSTLPMDDWLITPAVKLTKGQFYQVSFVARAASTNYPEKFSFWMGNEPTAEAMTTNLIETTDLLVTDRVTYSASVIAKEDGLYYFGIYGESDADEYYIYIDDFNITAGIPAAAPAAIEDLSIKSDWNGEPIATITFNAPTKNIAGEALESLSKIVVSVDGEVIYTDNAPEVGAACTVVYEAPTFGTYNFTITCYNESGAGLVVDKAAYLGVNTPSAPAWAKWVANDNNDVTISWAAVTTDWDGAEMNPALISYFILDPFTGDLIDEGIQGTSYDLHVDVAEGEQEFVQYVVFAETAAGMSTNYAITQFGPVGTPYETPFAETFADGEAKYPWAVQIIEANNPDECEFAIVGDDYFGGELTSRDGDDGYLLIKGTNVNDTFDFTSARIKVNGALPKLTYYLFGISMEDENTVNTYVCCDGEETLVASDECLANMEWIRKSVDMSQYIGKVVDIRFEIIVKAYTFTMIDDIRIEDPMDYDLAAASIVAPSKVNALSDLNIEYTIDNLGGKTAEGYSISLYMDGNLVETQENLPALAADESYTGTFAKNFTIFEIGQHTFAYVINYPQDMDMSNNESMPVVVNVAHNSYPKVAIEGEENTGKVTLSWAAPVLDGESTIIDNFGSEDYPLWATESFGEWTLYNYNESNTYGISGADFPGSATAFGWILFDPNETAVAGQAGYETYDDGRYMAAFAHQQGANDAWLVSPALTGEAQTISFVAKCATQNYGPETMEFWYSKAGTDPEDFVQLEIPGYDTAAGVPEDWTSFSVDVPEGTTHFAVRSTGNDAFILMVTAFEFKAFASYPEGFEVVGYNVYRDQELIATITETSYVDDPGNGEFSYAVSAIYSFEQNGETVKAESAPSNIYNVTITESGLSSLATAKSVVKVDGKQIIVENATSVVISAVDGKLVASSKNEPTTRATVAAGVYMVKTNDQVVKVIVK